MKNNMTDYDAVMIAEGVHEADVETSIKAWQHLIDTSLVWGLQGWFGRTANHLISQGFCHQKREKVSHGK